MDPQVKNLLSQLFAEGPVRHAFAKVLGAMQDENLDRMRKAVKVDDSRQAFACLEIERVLSDMPEEIQRILNRL